MSDDSKRSPSKEPAPPVRKPRSRRPSPAPAAATSAIELAETSRPLAETLPPAPSLDDLRAAAACFIRARPLTSMALAIGLGYLLGRRR